MKMTTNRRGFIRQTAALLGGLALHQDAFAAFQVTKETASGPDPFSPPLHAAAAGISPEDDFWRQIRQAYAVSPTLVNLNNGGVCPAPRATLDALDYYNRMCNEAPSYYMWRILDQDREPLRENLAALIGANPEEIALNRNATEALNTIIFGLNLRAGDEVVLSKYDYPNMINAWKQRERRDGIKLVWVDLELPSEDGDALTDAFASKFTDRTRLVHLTHVINWNGQVLPVRQIADRAHARGIEVLVDGAHSFALLNYQIADLGCDYWGTSLHKWLCGPFGSGMLWIKKEKISAVWPLLANDKPDGDNIRKFESLGTRSFPIEMAIGYSLDLQNLIGTKRKQERLFFLKNYWAEQARTLPGAKLFTSLRPEWGCAIATIGFAGKKGVEVSDVLFNKWKIHTTSIDWEKVNGVRITPNVYTTTDELDKLTRALRSIATT